MNVFNKFHSYCIYSWLNPFFFKSYKTSDSIRVFPLTSLFLSLEIITTSIFYGAGLEVSIVLTNALMAKSIPYSNVKSSLYSYLRKLLAAKLFYPIAVAFQPA